MSASTLEGEVQVPAPDDYFATAQATRLLARGPGLQPRCRRPAYPQDMAAERQFDIVLEVTVEGGFVVSVPDLPGCWTRGETRAEALANAKEAIGAYLETPSRTRQAASDAQARARQDHGVSARLPAVSGQLVRVLERKGWKLVRTRGSHLVFAHPDDPKLVTVPNHPGGVKRPLVAGILKAAGMSREEFMRLL